MAYPHFAGKTSLELKTGTRTSHPIRSESCGREGKEETNERHDRSVDSASHGPQGRGTSLKRFSLLAVVIWSPKKPAFPQSQISRDSAILWHESSNRIQRTHHPQPMRPHRDMQINLMLLPSHTPAEHVAPAPVHLAPLDSVVVISSCPEALEQHRRLVGVLDRSERDVLQRSEQAGGARESISALLIIHQGG